MNAFKLQEIWTIHLYVPNAFRWEATISQATWSKGNYFMGNSLWRRVSVGTIIELYNWGLNQRVLCHLSMVWGSTHLSLWINSILSWTLSNLANYSLVTMKQNVSPNARIVLFCIMHAMYKFAVWHTCIVINILLIKTMVLD